MNNEKFDEVTTKIILSENFETRGEGPAQQIVIVNPKLNLRVDFIPTNLSFCVSTLTSNAKPGDHKLALSIKCCQDSSSVFESGLNTVSVPNGTDEFTLNFDLRNIVIKQIGEYKIEFNIDDKTFSETFYLKLAGQ